MNCHDAAIVLRGQRFSATECEAWIALRCKVCGARWRINRRRDGTVHAGNVLALLDHAARHADRGEAATR